MKSTAQGMPRLPARMVAWSASGRPSSHSTSARFAGATNYNRFFGSLSIGFNGLFCFSTYALSLCTQIGFLIAGLSFLVALIYLGMKLGAFRSHRQSHDRHSHSLHGRRSAHQHRHSRRIHRPHLRGSETTPKFIVDRAVGFDHEGGDFHHRRAASSAAISLTASRQRRGGGRLRQLLHGPGGISRRSVRHPISGWCGATFSMKRPSPRPWRAAPGISSRRNADVRFGLEHPERDLQQNTLGTFRVLEAMRARGIRDIGLPPPDRSMERPRSSPRPRTRPCPSRPPSTAPPSWRAKP